MDCNTEMLRSLSNVTQQVKTEFDPSHSAPKAHAGNHGAT